MKTNSFPASYFGLAILAVLLMNSPSFGEPYTATYVSAVADVYYGSATGTNYSAVGGFMDNSATTWIAHTYSSAGAEFGINRASIMERYENLIPWPGQGDTTISWTGQASYSLRWSIPGSGQSGNIVNSLFMDKGSLDNELQGEICFIYGIPYEIQSVLSLSASGGPSYGEAISTWVDTITFWGKPTGTTGMATFEMNLLGFMHDEKYNIPVGPMWGGPWNVNQLALDFTGGVSLGNIDLPGGAWLEAKSGTDYPIHIPEPSTLYLLGSGLMGLIGFKRKTKIRKLLKFFR